MFGDDSRRENLQNGRAWVEYSAFENNSYAVLFKDIEIVTGEAVDLGKVDFENQIVEAEWYWTDQREKEEAEAAEQEFSELLEENWLDEREDWTYSSNFVADTEVSYSLMDRPKVYGNVLKSEKENLSIYLDEFSNGLFEPPLSSRKYDPMWVEGGGSVSG